MDKRCGNCGWYQPYETELSKKYIMGCKAPVPLWVEWAVMDTGPTDVKETTCGSDCPCHKPKEEGK